MWTYEYIAVDLLHIMRSHSFHILTFSFLSASYVVKSHSWLWSHLNFILYFLRFVQKIIITFFFSSISPSNVWKVSNKSKRILSRYFAWILIHVIKTLSGVICISNQKLNLNKIHAQRKFNSLPIGIKLLLHMHLILIKCPLSCMLCPLSCLHNFMTKCHTGQRYQVASKA